MRREYSKEWNILDETCSFCSKKAKFSLRRIKTNEWCFTCVSHDNFIGMENLMLLGYSKSDAREINKAVKSQIPNLFDDKRYDEVIEDLDKE